MMGLSLSINSKKDDIPHDVTGLVMHLILFPLTRPCL